MADLYDIEISEVADAEIDQQFLWLNARSPDLAIRWYVGIRRAIDSLSEFPERNPFLLGSSHRRQHLFEGYWIVYTIIEAEAQGQIGLVRVLRVFHGSFASQPS